LTEAIGLLPVPEQQAPDAAIVDDRSGRACAKRDNFWRGRRDDLLRGRRQNDRSRSGHLDLGQLRWLRHLDVGILILGGSTFTTEPAGNGLGGMIFA